VISVGCDSRICEDSMEFTMSWTEPLAASMAVGVALRKRSDGWRNGLCLSPLMPRPRGLAGRARGLAGCDDAILYMASTGASGGNCRRDFPPYSTVQAISTPGRAASCWLDQPPVVMAARRSARPRGDARRPASSIAIGENHGERSARSAVGRTPGQEDPKGLSRS